MSSVARAFVALLAVPATACIVTSASGTVERPFTRTFTVSQGSLVRVNVSGGSIRVQTVDDPDAQVQITLTARVRADSDAEVTSFLQGYDVVLEQQGAEVVASARRRGGQHWTTLLGHRGQASFRADVTAPAHVALDLDTSGGSISVRGERSSGVRADTSGGSIAVDGGAGDFTLDTSGGSIKVGQALGLLRADTSGGSITVDYVGPATRGVDLDTSGGGIRVGVDPNASLQINAGTSGGGVSVTGLPLVSDSRRRNQVTGVINGGKGPLRAHTSGGSIRIEAAERAR